MIDKLDTYMENLKPSDVTAGDPKAAIPMIREARTLWRRQAKADVIETAIKEAGNAASGLENGLRNEFRKLLKSQKYKWTDAERGALRRVVHGGLAANGLRFLGTFGIPVDQARNWLGAFSAVTAGGLSGGVPGAVALPAVGTAARMGARALTKSRANHASAVVRNAGVRPFNPATAQQYGGYADQLLRIGGQGVAIPMIVNPARAR
jgi:hypothetical protein